MIREEERVQKPIYYTSKAFQGAKAKYSKLEKIVFVLVIALRKLHPYFLAHPIIIMTDQQIRKTMNKIDVARHLVH